MKTSRHRGVRSEDRGLQVASKDIERSTRQSAADHVVNKRNRLNIKGISWSELNQLSIQRLHKRLKRLRKLL